MTYMTILQSGIGELLEYLSAHVLTCLVPAFFIAGGIAAMVSTGSVLKYFGPKAPKYLSYGMASFSGAILAVCSCTVLPLFAGIHKKGAGLGPAIAFLFSGPAINVLAIVLTARKIGWEIGLARAVMAIVFSIIVGLLMAYIFRKGETTCSDDGGMFDGEEGKPVGHLLAFFGTLMAILLFGASNMFVYTKISVIAVLLGFLVLVLVKWYNHDEIKEWLMETWSVIKLIVPVLLVGVFIAGILKAVIPPHWIETSVGGNSLSANLLASIFGALMYFSTLTEVPIVKAFLDMGMGKGPALALLLAGPSLSLPNMLVIRNVMGTKRTIAYILIVVILSTATGMMFGGIMGYHR